MVMCWFQDVGSLGFRWRAACCCVCNNGRDPTVNLSPSTSLVVDVKYIGRRSLHQKPMPNGTAWVSVALCQGELCYVLKALRSWELEGGSQEVRSPC